MLVLKDIKKTYESGDISVEALKGVSIKFRDSEFVSVLGQSGCGKTTLLNIIGGLDRYTSGDLCINGKSTKKFKDRDWDSYRNHSIGFVFQSYNLIPHQTVLANVELALTLSGVSKKERRKRAIDALTQVGLADQIKKKPNQMSGGQMQRVAIARALINDPDILLADEPTGALDSETSVQIMELLKSISKDRLIIMVTHNPDIAEKYSSRIVRLVDGKIVSDSSPYEAADEEEKSDKKIVKKPSMSFLTALSLSLNNLLTKKGRTFMTAFAGSIGIIGIALIMSLSDGFQNYIDRVQKDTLSNYPIALEAETFDMGAMLSVMSKDTEDDVESYDDDIVRPLEVMTQMYNSMVTDKKTNDLEEFKKFLESDDCKIKEYSSAVSYDYDLEMIIYGTDRKGNTLRVNPSMVMESMGMGNMTDVYSAMGSMSMIGGRSDMDAFEELIDNQELLDSQYDVVAGRWPEDKSELIIAVTGKNRIVDTTLYTLGLKDQAALLSFMQGKAIENEEKITYTYDELLNLTYKVVPYDKLFKYDEMSNTYVNMSMVPEYMEEVLKDGLELKVVGIIRPKEDVTASSFTNTVGYTKALTEYVAGLNDNVDEEKRAALGIGKVNLDSPSAIRIFPKDFDSKDKITDIIKEYNQKAIDDDKENEKISYTDYIGIFMSSVSNIIDTIAYVLIAFVAISLVVSSIMIGIITYVSVLERTKEIGILRSIGASKKDVARVFTAETFIEGLVSGVLGVALTILLNIPVNMVIKHYTDISNVSALPIQGALLLVLISTVLTYLAGFIPSRSAARKDPVEALRSE